MSHGRSAPKTPSGRGFGGGSSRRRFHSRGAAEKLIDPSAQLDLKVILATEGQPPAGSCGRRRRIRKARGCVHPALAHSLRSSITAASHSLCRAEHSIRCTAAGVQRRPRNDIVNPPPSVAEGKAQSEGVLFAWCELLKNGLYLLRRWSFATYVSPTSEPLTSSSRFFPQRHAGLTTSRTMAAPLRCCHTPARLLCTNRVANTESTENYARSSARLVVQSALRWGAPRRRVDRTGRRAGLVEAMKSTSTATKRSGASQCG